MPEPLSATSIHTDSSPTPLRRVMVPRSGPMAWAALTIRFMITWLICDGRHSTSGNGVYSLTTSALYLISLATMFNVESIPCCKLAICHSWLESTREKSFRSLTICPTRPMPSLDSLISKGMSSTRKSSSTCSRSLRKCTTSSGEAMAPSALP
ncbi:hypothetical protein D3C76_1243540 [compost metagenome]